MPYSKGTKNIQPFNCSTIQLFNCMTIQPFTYHPKVEHPLPHIQEMLESLEGSHIFSNFNLKLGFWQVDMDKASKQYTAFMVGSLGFFKCECMPFSLCNVPVTFQQLMQNCLGELNLTYCLIYLDDVTTFS